MALAARSRSLQAIARSLFSRGGLDHRHDVGLQGLGQVGPCFDHTGKVGVGRDIRLTQGNEPMVMIVSLRYLWRFGGS